MTAFILPFNLKKKKVPNALSTIIIIIIRAMPPRVSKPVNSDKQSETANVNPFDSIRGCWQCVSLNRMAFSGNLFPGVPDICQRLWMYMRGREFDSADISLNHTQGRATLPPREAIKELSHASALQRADSPCCHRGTRSTSCCHSLIIYSLHTRFEHRQPDE